MSIRLIALYIIVAGLCIYSWKDWFKSLCGLILMMAFIWHEDMPTSMFGIQGFNMWNLLFIGIFLAWLASRRREGLRWDMPRHVNVLLLMYLGVILIGFFRAVFDRSYMQGYPIKSLISEELINTIKWVLPGVLLFDGCRTHRRVLMALICLLAVYFLVSVQVIRVMPSQAVFSSVEVMNRSRLKLGKYLGYSACDISTMLAGASWGIIAALPLIRQKKYKVLVLVAAGIVLFGQALTGGRAGYLAWGATGLILCLLKWRKYLILVPVFVILLPIVFPSVAERMLTGFGQIDVSGQNIINKGEVGSGRFDVWPIVIDKIEESPLLGYGRLAMIKTGLYDYTGIELSEAYAQPHNMYLETLIDNGILGSIPILLFWGVVVIYSGRLFRSKNRLYSAVGGLALSLTLVQLIAGIGSQHFYPEESTLGMWATVFISLRVYLEQARVRESLMTAESSWNGQLLQQQQAAVASG